MIVAQCALAAGDDREALVRRDIELLAAHGERWFAALEPFNEIVVHRGFVERLVVDAKDLRIAEAFAREPVEHLTIDQNPGEAFSSNFSTAQLMCALMRPEVTRVRRLDLPERICRDGLLIVANAPKLSQLRALHIRDPWISDADFGHFVRGRMLESLEELRVETKWAVRYGTLGRSLSRLALPALRRLSLRGQGLANASLLGLVGSPVYPKLEALDLYETPDLDSDIIEPLLAGGRLRSLGLGYTGFCGSHAIALASVPHAARLVQLDLSDTHVDAYANELGAAYLPALRDLDLGCRRHAGGRVRVLESGALSPIYDARWVPQLETLRLDGRAIGDAGLARLLARPLPALRTLTLSCCALSMDAIAMLAEADLPSLEVLDLSENPRLLPTAMAALAHAPWMQQLRALRMTIHVDAPPMRVREIRFDKQPRPRIRARSLAPPLWPARSLLGSHST